MQRDCGQTPPSRILGPDSPSHLQFRLESKLEKAMLPFVQSNRLCAGVSNHTAASPFRQLWPKQWPPGSHGQGMHCPDFIIPTLRFDHRVELE